MRKQITPALACLVLQTLCIGPSLADGKARIPLQAGIEHAEQLPEIKLSAATGQKFDLKHIYKFDDKEWFEIPSWLGGTWRSIQRIRTSRYDNKTGDVNSQETVVQERERETFGYQQDRLQNIWSMRATLDPLVSSSTILSTDTSKEPTQIPVTKYCIRQFHPLDEDDAKVNFKILDTVITVYDKSNDIESIEQREIFRTYMRLATGILAVQSDEQTYDRHGQPIARSTISEIRKRDAELKIVDEYKMVNLLASFKNFLQKSGQNNISPER